MRLGRLVCAAVFFGKHRPEVTKWSKIISFVTLKEHRQCARCGKIIQVEK